MHFLAGFMLLVFQIHSVQADAHQIAKRQASVYYSKWENNTVNVFFEESFPLEFQAMFRDAVDYLGSHTCIKFREDPHADYKLIFAYDEHKCQSLIGHQRRTQFLRFAYECAAFGVAVHEIMHALGVQHSQSRDDRDKYLIVDSDNYNDDKEDETFNPVPFDYGSIMLYRRNDNRIPRDPEHNYTMGNLRVAFYDMILLNEFYQCKCQTNLDIKCLHGGYQNPSNCDRCLCTDGFTGKHCEKMEGTVVNATKEWQEQGYYLTLKSGADRNTMPIQTYFHVVAPENATIQVQLLKLEHFFCQSTCDYNGVEIKYKEDRRITSPLVCCDNDNLWNKTRSSRNNPLVIVKYGNDRGPYMNFRYRYVDGDATEEDGGKKGLLTNEIN